MHLNTTGPFLSRVGQSWVCFAGRNIGIRHDCRHKIGVNILDHGDLLGQLVVDNQDFIGQVKPEPSKNRQPFALDQLMLASAACLHSSAFSSKYLLVISLFAWRTGSKHVIIIEP